MLLYEEVDTVTGEVGCRPDLMYSAIAVNLRNSNLERDCLSVAHLKWCDTSNWTSRPSLFHCHVAGDIFPPAGQSVCLDSSHSAVSVPQSASSAHWQQLIFQQASYTRSQELNPQSSQGDDITVFPWNNWTIWCCDLECVTPPLCAVTFFCLTMRDYLNCVGAEPKLGLSQ